MTEAKHSEMILIDGAGGEGGGQILRSSVALSMVSGRPMKIERIRAGRNKPGLLRQHLTAVLAARDVCAATVIGAEIGSKSLEFTPGQIKPGEYDFRVGTAGSATLVLQTILPALMLADAPSKIRLGGGTHNPWSPPFEFLAESYLPLVNRLGPTISAKLNRFGFYPAGGGEFDILIEPCKSLEPIDLLTRGDLIDRELRSLVVDLSPDIGKREIDKAIRSLGWNRDDGSLDYRERSGGPGNVLTLRCRYQNLTTIMTSFGRVGVSAETVAKDLVAQFRSYEKHQGVLDEYLCDQWMLPLAIAVAQTGRSAEFLTGPLSQHSLTHREWIERFLPVRFEIEKIDPSVKVRVAALT